MIPVYVLGAIGVYSLYIMVRNNYIAGRTEQAALGIFRALKKEGFYVISDSLGEEVRDAVSAWRSFRSILSHLRVLSENNFAGHAIAVKPSNVGLHVSKELCFKLVFNLCREASKRETFVRIDAEKRGDRKAVLELAEYLKERGLDNFWVCVQANHSDARIFLSRYVILDVPVCLVKGAYRDGDLSDKEIDEHFMDLVFYYNLQCHLNGRSNRLSIDTHDRRLINLSRPHYRAVGFLYGIYPSLAKDCLVRGEKVYVYSAWGGKYAAFLGRRLREGVRWKTLGLFVRNLKDGYEFRKQLPRL